jgi:hypothetical protein
MSLARVRANDAGFLLAAAALVWVVVLVLGLWLDQHPDAPSAFGVAAFVLALLVLPFTVGVAMAWQRPTGAHLVGVSSLAGVLAEWAFLFAAGLITTVTDFERQVAYLSIFDEPAGSPLGIRRIRAGRGHHGGRWRGGCGANSPSAGGPRHEQSLTASFSCVQLFNSILEQG